MFKKNKKFLGFILTFILVLSMSVGVFAETIIKNTQPDDFELIVEDGNIDYKAVTVEGGGLYEDVTKYTSYIEFPKGSTQDLSSVDVTVKYDNNFQLKISDVILDVDDIIGNNKISNVKNVDFSRGYVQFLLVDNNNPQNNKEYQVNAGIKGQDIELIFTFDMHNAQDWLAGEYKGQYDAPKPNEDAELKARVQNVIDGFGEIPAVMPLNIEVGQSAMDALIKASQEYDFYIDGADQGYIRKIGKTSNNTLGEFDINNYSGWMYKINDIMPNIGASQYTLSNSDKTMEWGFTMDYGQDLGGAPW